MKFKKQILKNGIRLITIPMIDNPAVTVLVMVEAGSKYETKRENGLSHFLEHMVFKGSLERPKPSDISRELDSIGAQYNAFTSHEYTGYWAKAGASHIDKVIDVIGDMYSHPVFDEREMEKEKGVIVEEIRMYNDLPQRKVYDVFMELLYGDQPAGWDIAGTEENVRAFTKEMLTDYRNRFYTSRATTVIVSGSFDEKIIAKKIFGACKDVKDTKSPGKKKVKDTNVGKKISVHHKDTEQSHIVLGFRSFPIKDKRVPVAHVLNGILGAGMSSRLFSKMRDNLGICYYIRAEHEMFTDHGFFAISAGVDNTRLEQGIRGIIEECVKLKNELVGDSELNKVKEYIAGTTMLELETSEARAQFCAYQELLKGKIDLPDEIIKKVRAVTAKQVRDLARELFVEDNIHLAMVSKHGENKVRHLVTFANN